MFEITIKNYNAGNGVTYEEYHNIKSYHTTPDETWLVMYDTDGFTFYVKVEQILEFYVEKV